MIDKKHTLIVTSLFCIILFKRLVFLNIGVNYEEARDLDVIIKISNGEVIYKDFLYIYGFLGLYFNAILFKLFGFTDITIPRFIVSLFFAVSSMFAYKIASRFLSPFWAFVAVLLGFSGLVSREHTYEHIVAFWGTMVALWGGLSYVNKEDVRHLAYAGLASGAVLFSQPLPLGVLTVFSLTSLLSYKFLFCGNKRPQPYIFFISGVLAFPLAGCLYFFLNGALIVAMKSMFLPMISGNAPHPNQLFFVPPIFPKSLFSASSLGEIKSILNFYLSYNLRWWLVLSFFIIGTGYSTYNLYKDKENKIYLSILLLSAFSLVFEIKRILRPGASAYISLFPTFVLLIYFGIEMKVNQFLKYFVQMLVALLFMLYFVYTPVVYYAEYNRNGFPLGLIHAKNVIVKPYTHEIYNETTNFIRENTGEKDKILVADHNSFFYLFSNRNSLFPENWYVFSGTTFHPYSKTFSWSLEEQLKLENKIIKRIKIEKPGLIIIPSRFLSPELIDLSPFLKYVASNWKLCKKIGAQNKKSVFDDNIETTIYCPS
jgi:hypothetical protein